MSGLLGLHGLSKTTGVNTLIAAYGNGFINVGTGIGYGIPITSTNNVEFEEFLDSLFFQNFADTPLSFNGTVWSRRHVSKVPLAKYIKQQGQRLYLGYVNLNGTTYPSRVWYSDLPVNDTIVWGYEAGSNGSAIAGNTLFTSLNAGFKTYNVQRGDPLFITSGSNAGQYFIQQIVDDQHIILTEALKYTESNLSYWAGDNFIDFARDDGDFLTELEENNNQLIAFKRDSLHRYDGSRLVKIRDAFGTTSGRSVANLRELSIYFHGSQGDATGFYVYDGNSSTKISAPIQKHIDGISSNMYGSIVSWVENNLFRSYVGTITNSNYNISIPNAVVTWDYANRAWSVDPIADTILVSTQFRQSNTKQTYIGTSDDQILVTPSGNDFNGNAIPHMFEITDYPNGTQAINTFNRLQVISESARGMQIQYKLLLAPFESDEEYQPLGQLDHERTELYFPEFHNQASGIGLRFLGIDAQEATSIIKKMTIFYIPGSSIIQ